MLVGIVGERVKVLARVEASDRAALQHGARVTAVLQHDRKAGQRHGHCDGALRVKEVWGQEYPAVGEEEGEEVGYKSLMQGS